MNINFAIVAHLPNIPEKVYHACGYENMPTQNDVDSLKKELNEDPEFGLQGYILEFRLASDEEVKFIKNLVIE